jgi:hypothetical protein
VSIVKGTLGVVIEYVNVSPLSISELLNVPTSVPILTFSLIVFADNVISVGASLILLTLIVKSLEYVKPLASVLTTVNVFYYIV